MIIWTYKLARDGLTEGQIAKTLGIAKVTLMLWETKKPLFKMALEHGRRDHKFSRKNSFDMSKYIYDSLSPKHRIVWRKLNRINEMSPGIEKVEAFFANRSKDTRQRMFLAAFCNGGFSIAAACRMVGIHRATFELWKNDPGFQEMIREVEEVKKDWYVRCFDQSVSMGDTSARIAAVRMLCRDRGFNDKQEVDVKVQGRIEHTHQLVLMDQMDLPLPVRKMLLKEVRRVKQIESQEVGSKSA